MSAVNKRAYENVTDDEFFAFLDEHVEYEIVNVENVNEIVVDCPLPDESRSIRIFSGIEKGTGQSRGAGGDAIRNVIWDHELDEPVGGRKHTRRIKTWRKNLLKKIEDLYASWRDFDQECPECSATMVLRENNETGNEFWGCTRWPECDGSKDA